ncbi:hypothetical protein [Phocaeicola plebeius]
MKEEKKYQITGTTNGWIAQRDLMFNGKTRIIIEKELTLKEAYKELLDMFNSDYEDKGWYAKNWGIAVNISKQKASPTCSDGTRMYEYDGRYYQIEEQEEPEEVEYTVTDNETGNCEIYRGSDLNKAKQAVRDEWDDSECDWKDNTAWDIRANGDTIFNGCINNLEDLGNL